MSSVWASTLLMWWPLYTAVYVAVVHWVYVFSFGIQTGGTMPINRRFSFPHPLHRARIHASVNNAIIGSDNGLSPVRRQTISRTSVESFSIGPLSHWGRVTHKCGNKLTIFGSDNGLSPDRRQAIIWSNAGILLIGPLGTNLSEIFIGIHTFSFTKMQLKMSSGKCRPFCPGLNVLRAYFS